MNPPLFPNATVDRACVSCTILNSGTTVQKTFLPLIADTPIPSFGRLVSVPMGSIVLLCWKWSNPFVKT